MIFETRSARSRRGPRGRPSNERMKLPSRSALNSGSRCFAGSTVRTVSPSSFSNVYAMSGPRNHICEFAVVSSSTPRK
jgi:hypothetical protein